jgi:hypothetical protein
LQIIVFLAIASVPILTEIALVAMEFPESLSWTQ